MFATTATAQLVLVAALMLSALGAVAAPPQIKLLMPGGGPPHTTPHIIPQQDWFFGFTVQLEPGQGGGLRVLAVRPGGPAAQAGLEPGDMIRSAGNVRFSQLWSNSQAIALLKSQVISAGYPGEGPIATAQGGPVMTFLKPVPTTQFGSVMLRVRDIRSGSTVPVTVFPRLLGGGPIATLKL